MDRDMTKMQRYYLWCGYSDGENKFRSQQYGATDGYATLQAAKDAKDKMERLEQEYGSIWDSIWLLKATEL